MKSLPPLRSIRVLWELPEMMSEIFLAFLTPSLPCPHLDLIYIMKFAQPPLLHPLFHDFPPMWTSYLEAPLRRAVLPAPFSAVAAEGRKEGSGDADGVLEKAVNREGKRWRSRKRTSQSREIDSNFVRVRVIAKD